MKTKIMLIKTGILQNCFKMAMVKLVANWIIESKITNECVCACALEY